MSAHPPGPRLPQPIITQSVTDAISPKRRRNAPRKVSPLIVMPHLEGTLRTPTMPHAEVLAQERLTGRYLDEDQSDWRHT